MKYLCSIAVAVTAAIALLACGNPPRPKNALAQPEETANKNAYSAADFAPIELHNDFASLYNDSDLVVVGECVESQTLFFSNQLYTRQLVKIDAIYKTESQIGSVVVIEAGGKTTVKEYWENVGIERKEFDEPETAAEGEEIDKQEVVLTHGNTDLLALNQKCLLFIYNAGERINGEEAYYIIDWYRGKFRYIGDEFVQDCRTESESRLSVKAEGIESMLSEAASLSAGYKRTPRPLPHSPVSQPSPSSRHAAQIPTPAPGLATATLRTK